MIGRALSLEGKLYNIIILAGGNGTRMGEQSDYIPKALSQLGSKRAIDYIIERYIPVAHKFIIGIGKNGDLLEQYIRGRFPGIIVEFSKEVVAYNNAISTMYGLDHADSHFGTIVLFCDLIVISNPVIRDDTILVAGQPTKGIVGTFRHHDTLGRGVLGHFVFSDTKLLKAVTYTGYIKQSLKDLTEDIVYEYDRVKRVTTELCNVVYEFGNKFDLMQVRKLWEDA